MVKTFCGYTMNRISSSEKSGMNHNRVWSDDERKDSVITVRGRDEEPTEVMATNIKEIKKGE